MNPTDPSDQSSSLPSSAAPASSAGSSSAADAHINADINADTNAYSNPASIHISFDQLLEALSHYLNEAELQLIQQAYQFSEQMHSGQKRHSGDPYISHPLAVAYICAQWKLDTQAIMAALLHDVIEDQGVLKEELGKQFGGVVAELVDGLSKLEKIQFQNQVDAQAENFRKMILATARDVRVILVKLADRLHNMRTLSVMYPEKKRRIARETMEVYAPIAHRLGLNNIYRELLDLAFLNLYPLRYHTLTKAVHAVRGNRRELVHKILMAVKDVFTDKLKAEIQGREKTLYGIYRKMRGKHLSFSQVLDVYGFRVIVENQLDCYIALGLLHSLFKPMPGKFKDYIAIAKLNGYQSLHTTLIGPYGTPIEFQIRTQHMHRVAEAGVAAHWLYKNDASLSELEQRTHAWLQSLLDIQRQTGDSVEFLEHVKFDLFPDSVYVFTPKTNIIALPRGATVLDFAYNIHTDVGDQAIAAKVNHEPASLRQTLHNGDIVEIITSPTSCPTPHWLSFVHTGKARSAIRHYLRTAKHTEAAPLGERLLIRALSELEIDHDVPDLVLEKLLKESGLASLSDLYMEIGIGQRIPALVARRLAELLDADQQSVRSPVQQLTEQFALKKNRRSAIIIHGNEGGAIQFAACCAPIPDDSIIAQLKRGQGLIVHRDLCLLAKRMRAKDPENWVEVIWDEKISRLFACKIKVTVQNIPGALARVATEIASSAGNIIQVSMDEEPNAMLSHLLFTVQLQNRLQLARILRNVRRINAVAKVQRESD